MRSWETPWAASCLSGVTRGGGDGRWFAASMGAPGSGLYLVRCVAHSSWHTRGVPSVSVEFSVLRGQGFLCFIHCCIHGRVSTGVLEWTKDGSLDVFGVERFGWSSNTRLLSSLQETALNPWPGAAALPGPARPSPPRARSAWPSEVSSSLAALTAQPAPPCPPAPVAGGGRWEARLDQGLA